MSEHDPFTEAPQNDTNLHSSYRSLDPPKQEDETISGSDLHELADAGTRHTPAERNETTSRDFIDPEQSSKTAPNDYKVSAEHAAEALAETRRIEAEFAQQDADAKLQAEVDQVRAGQEPTEQQPQPELQLQPEATPSAELTPELDRLLEALPVERRAPFLQTYNDMVQQAQYAAQTEHQQAVQQLAGVGQRFENGIAQAVLTAEAAALAPFPELHGVPRDQIDAVMAHIGRTNPQRHQQIRQHVAAIKELAGSQIQAAQTLHQLQVQTQQQQEQKYRQDFKAWADAQDQALEKTSWANETPENRNAIAREIVEHYKQYGVSKQDLIDNYNKNPAMRHAATQSLIADGIRYRQAQKAAQRAQVRPVPQVQKPGAANEERRDYSEYSHLERQFRGQSLSPRQAAQLLIAKGAR
jgi:hypothetical protein